MTVLLLGNKKCLKNIIVGLALALKWLTSTTRTDKSSLQVDVFHVENHLS